MKRNKALCVLPKADYFPITTCLGRVLFLFTFPANNILFIKDTFYPVKVTDDVDGLALQNTKYFLTAVFFKCGGSECT